MPKQSDTGNVKKLCDCGRSKWSGCSHPWYCDYKAPKDHARRPNDRYRKNLDLAAGKHAPYAFGDCSHGDNTNTFLLSRIDWILAQPGDQKTLECSGYRVATEATGSDHKPVLTQLTLR